MHLLIITVPLCSKKYSSQLARFTNSLHLCKDLLHEQGSNFCTCTKYEYSLLSSLVKYIIFILLHSIINFPRPLLFGKAVIMMVIFTDKPTIFQNSHHSCSKTALFAIIFFAHFAVGTILVSFAQELFSSFLPLLYNIY